MENLTHSLCALVYAKTLTVSNSFELDYDTSITGSQAAVGAVYKGVQVNGANYEYFYDADGHRRFKSYPLGSGQTGTNSSGMANTQCLGCSRKQPIRFPFRWPTHRQPARADDKPPFSLHILVRCVAIAARCLALVYSRGQVVPEGNRGTTWVSRFVSVAVGTRCPW